MDTDKKIDLHAKPPETYLLKEETGTIINCAFEVINGLGHGLNEKCYENSLVVEFRQRGIAFALMSFIKALLLDCSSLI